jgi:predicted dehydrogenase
MTPRVKIGIIGAGKIVEDAHLPVLLTLPGVSVAWITDQSEQRRGLLSRMYRVSAVTPERALERIEEVDVCLIAVPLGARSVYFERCIDCGTAIYVEKPFARNAAEHQQLQSRMPAYRLTVGFQRRAYHCAQTLQQLIASGMLGKLQSIRLTEANFTLIGGGAASFRTSASSAGGGITIESSIHSLDLMQYLTAAVDVKTERVRGVVRDGIDYHVECESRLTLRDNQEIPVSVLMSRLKSLPDAFHFHFENATVAYPVKPQFPVRIRSSAAETLWQTLVPNEFGIGGAYSINGAFSLFWQHFLAGLRDQQQGMTSACTSLLTSVWVEQIYRSMQS